MHISPFFHNLRSAYEAELDDMRHDSDGQLVLDRRLAQRRGEIEFLVSMMEVSPEMVAVVLHKAFRFTSALAMQQVLASEPEEFPDWDKLSESTVIAPWATPIIKMLRQHPDTTREDDRAVHGVEKGFGIEPGRHGPDPQGASGRMRRPRAAGRRN